MSLKNFSDKYKEYVIKSRENILKMLNYRGFNTDKYNNFTDDELEIYYNENALNMLVEHKENDESCLIYYLRSEKTNPKSFRLLLGSNTDGTINLNVGLFDKKNYEQGLLKENTKTIIFIFIINEIFSTFLKKDEELPQQQKTINFYHNFYKKQNNNIFLQLFEIKRFLFNVMEHHLVPKHEILGDDEYQNEVIKKYKITSKNQLPIIKKDDPIARYIGLQTDQVCKITRRSESVGTYIGFRICK